MTSWPQKIHGEARVAVEASVPESYVDMIESRLIADAARKAHEGGGQFAAWPKVTRTPVRFPEPQDNLPYWDMKPCELADAAYLHVRLEGWAIPR